MRPIPDYLSNLDTSVFTVQAALSPGDRQSFLRIQRLIAQRIGGYDYLEIGSELGGSLVPHLLDPGCKTAVSIDLRPLSQPDERGTVFYYPDNTTARMKETIAASIGAAPLQKLVTFDSDASGVSPQSLPAKVDLAMIDGEHTDTACFADFCQVMGFVKDDAIIAFHDANLISDAIQNAERMLTYLKIPFTTVFLPECVVAIGIRGMSEAVASELTGVANERSEYLRTARQGRWISVANSMAESGQLAPLEAAREEANRTKDLLASAVERVTVLEAEGQVIGQSQHAAGLRVAELERAHAEAAARVAALESSTSWKVTAPIRAIRRAFQ